LVMLPAARLRLAMWLAARLHQAAFLTTR